MAPWAHRRLNAAFPHAWAWLWTAIFVTPWCGLLFGCGCTWLWAGAARFCNIHHTSGAHCPWCMHGTEAFLVTAAGIALAQSAVVGILQRRGHSGRMATLAGIATFFLAGSIAAWVWAVAL